jgi:hypothetical protein
LGGWSTEALVAVAVAVVVVLVLVVLVVLVAKVVGVKYRNS